MNFRGFKNDNSHDALVGLMLGTYAEEEGRQAFSSLVSIVQSACGEDGIVTVIRVVDRKVIATSGTADGVLDAFLGTIDFVDRRTWHSRTERSGIAFRKGINYVSVRPLIYGNRARYSVILETAEKECLSEKVFEVLAMAVEIAERDGNDLSLFDGRESLEWALGKMPSGCVLTIGISGKFDLFGKRREELALEVAKVVSNERTAYRTGECRFAVITGGSGFAGATEASQILTECAEAGMDFLSAGVSECCGDPLMAIMLSEKALREAERGGVRVLCECRKMETEEVPITIDPVKNDDAESDGEGESDGSDERHSTSEEGKDGQTPSGD